MTRSPVLLVEDDSDSSEALVLLLGIQGFPVVTVGDGEEALNALRGGLRPCVVVLDLYLPGVDGFHVLSQMKTVPAWAGIPIIVVSGRDEPPEEMAEHLGIPVDHCFSKPSDPDELARMIAQHCGN